MVKDACNKNPPLLISADAGARKFLISWTVMSTLLACILACISERQTWHRHQGNVFYWHKLLKITLKPELERTAIACLVDRDVHEVLYTGFVQTPSGYSRRLRFVPDICKADIPRGGGVLPYMGYMGMCRCEGYGFQAVYSRIGYINQSVWV